MEHKLKVLELFGGIGACTKALKRLGIPIEVVDYVDNDKYACYSYNAINGANFETQDICEWDKDIEADLIMHGSPCQDFSLAGKQAGGDEGSGTRSSLMYETIRIVKKLRPKYVIWENVKNVLSVKHKHNFYKYIQVLSGFDYISFTQVLNAKDYGIPQNRERVFVVSIRQDIKKDFKFPSKSDLNLRLKDVLENNVDERYYLSDRQIEMITNWKSYRNPIEKAQTSDEICNCITARGNTNMNASMLLIKNATKQGYDEATEGDGVSLQFPNSTTKRGRVGHGVSQTLQCSPTMGVITNNMTIRKLTPKECWRLMGFDDEDFEKAKEVNSDTQLYKQAGNSIVVNVLEAIFKNLLME